VTRDFLELAAASLAGAAVGAAIIWYGLLWIFRGGR
jgi:hypothetical protein